MYVIAPDLALAPALLVPSWRGRPRLITCHRADLDATHAPNSLAAVQAAVEAGAPRIEVDLRFLADDTMVVFHDPGLSPTTDGQGLLDALAIGDLRDVRSIGVEPSPIPLFSEVIDTVAGSSTTLHVDLKHDRPLPDRRVEAIVHALAPVASHAIVGTQAYWNLPVLASRGLRVALDPGSLWQRGTDRIAGDGEFPRTPGLYGFWDDSPLAQVPGIEVTDYLRIRFNEIAGLVPAAEEWMVDIDTIRHCHEIGFALTDLLHARGIRVAAWTIQDASFDGAATAALLASLFDLDVDVIIAKHGLIVGSYLTSQV